MSTLRLVPPGGAPIDIAADRALIGRDPGVDIVVNDPSVSRRHALLERRPEGWVVVDQRSANGTFINEQRIEQAALQNGLLLRLGAVNFNVVLPMGASAPRGAMTIPPQPGYPPQPQPYGAPGYPPQPGPAYPPAAPSYPAPAPGYPPAAPAAPNYPPTIPPSYAPPSPASVYPGAAPPGYPPAAPGYPPAAPGYPPAGAPAPAAPPRAPAAAAAPPPGGMSEAEAAEILGLWPGSPADEVRRRYQKLYNDFQIRLTNAPTPSLKKMYQKNIQDLRIACDVICPGVSV